MLWWLLLLAALGAGLIVVWKTRSRTKPGAGARPKAARPKAAQPKATRPKATPPKAAKPTATKPKARPKAGGPDRTGPQPGEIWWADVPYEDYSGHKVRPCVVIRAAEGYREVLKI